MTDALTSLLLALGGGAVGGGAGVLAARVLRARPAQQGPRAVELAARVRAEAQAEAEAATRGAEIVAREEALAARAAAEAGLRLEEERLGRLATSFIEREVDAAARTREIEE